MPIVARIALVAGFLLWTADSHACQCGEYPKAREAAQKATAVFEGTVVKRWPAVIEMDGAKYPTQWYTFAVHGVWKGVSTPDLRTLQGLSNCSHWFETGEKYVVFATPHETVRSALDVHKCSGPSGPSRTSSATLAELGTAVQTFAHTSIAAPTAVSRLSQHVAVYFVCGVLALDYSLRQPAEFRWPLLALLIALAAAVFIAVTIFRRTASIATRTASVLFALLTVATTLLLVTGYIFVQNSQWFGHLLEGWTSM
jgi:hypothetical protein